MEEVSDANRCGRCHAVARRSDPRCESCGAELRVPAWDESTSGERDALLGSVIADGYRLRQLIAVSAMGKVYEAEQLALGRPVAIKVIRPAAGERAELGSRFHNEARATSRLNHPNIVSMIDYGVEEDGAQYLVMEYLDGRDLRDVIDAEGPISLARAVDLTLQALAGLAHAHELGIVHRDVKPENLMVTRRRDGGETLKIVDFGLARLTAVDPSHLSQPGRFLGTPTYASPEQCRGLELSIRSDLYSMGVVLFELLTGRAPFEAKSTVKLIMQQITEPPPDPREVRPDLDISEGLAKLLARALEKEPEKRFGSAARMAAALAKSFSPNADSPEGPSCSRCGERVRSSNAFCGACGHRLHETSSSGMVRRGRSPSTGATLDDLAAVAPLDVFDVPGRATVAVIHPGASEILDELSDRMSERGDFVVRLGAHESNVPVAYHAARELLRALLAFGRASLEGWVASPPKELSPLERAALLELMEARPLIPGPTRVPAFARLIASAIAHLAIDDGQRISVLLHDADLVGEASRATLDALVSLAPVPTLVVIGAPELSFEIGEHVLVLRSRPGEGAPTGGDQPEPLEQSLDRLGPSPRLALQAIAVLGGHAPLGALEHLVPEALEGALSALDLADFIERRGGETWLVRPRERALIEAQTPIEVRRRLHDAALEWRSTESSPIEVRAHHATHGSDLATGLLLLDHLGTVARARGDRETALRAYRRILQLVGRAMMSDRSADMERTMAAFSRQIATVLLEQRRFVEAEGTLEETLDYTPLADRPATEVLLARIALERGRLDAARTAFLRARERLDTSPANRVAAQRGLAAVHQRAGGPDLARALLEEAVREPLMPGEDPIGRVPLMLDLARLCRGPDTKLQLLNDALAVIRQAGRLTLEAEVLIALADVHRARGEAQAAREHLETAIERAADAADLSGHERARRRLAAI